MQRVGRFQQLQEVADMEDRLHNRRVEQELQILAVAVVEHVEDL